jgi:hypothetical protein
MNTDLVIQFVIALASAQCDFGHAGKGNPAPPAEVGLVVERLGSPDYRLREKAHGELAAIGEAARTELILARRHLDPEISIRATHLLDCLDREAMWSGSSVKLRPGCHRAEHLLEEIARQSGIPISISRLGETSPEAYVPISGVETEFWRAVDAVCKDLHGALRWQFDTRGGSSLVWVPSAGPLATSVCGALRCEILSAEPIVVETMSGQTTAAALELGLRLSWEPKLDVVAVQERPHVHFEAARMECDESAARPESQAWQFVRNDVPTTTTAVRVPLKNWDQKLFQKSTVRWDVIAVGPQGTPDRRRIQFHLAAEYGTSLSRFIESLGWRGIADPNPLKRKTTREDSNPLKRITSNEAGRHFHAGFAERRSYRRAVAR